MAISFAIDFGSLFYFDGLFPDEGVVFSKKHTVMVLPPNHHTVGQLAEEKNVVFDIEDGRVLNLPKWNLQVELDYITSTTDEFRALTPQKRDCLFGDELKLRLFKSYSEANCFLECAWEHAEKLCHCVPWFLLDLFPHSDMCEVYGNKCFRTIVDQRYSGNIPCQYQCLQDCDKVRYIAKTIVDNSFGVRKGEYAKIILDFYKFALIFYCSFGTNDGDDLFYDYVIINKTSHTSENVLKALEPLQLV